MFTWLVLATSLNGTQSNLGIFFEEKSLTCRFRDLIIKKKTQKLYLLWQ